MRLDKPLINVARTMAASAMLAGVPASAEQTWKIQASMGAGESLYTNIEKN